MNNIELDFTDQTKKYGINNYQAPAAIMQLSVFSPSEMGSQVSKLELDDGEKQSESI